LFEKILKACNHGNDNTNSLNNGLLELVAVILFLGTYKIGSACINITLRFTQFFAS
jgi:hypothetical protein